MDNRITLGQQTITEKGETIGTLVISHLNRSDDGLYRCIAENPAGNYSVKIVFHEELVAASCEEINRKKSYTKKLRK